MARAGHEPEAAVRESAPGCRIVLVPVGSDVPHIRGAGLATATGEWVALTEDHCVADAGWLAAYIEAAGQSVDMLGGAVGNAQRERAIDCAAYFAEYGFFGATAAGAGRVPPLITGANVVYHRRVVGDVASWASRGEWENVIHTRLHDAGRVIRLVPSARVRQNLRYGIAAFCRDRFEHGRDFAATRARGITAVRRAVLAAGTVALPPVLAWRIARLADRGEREQFVRALPMTLLFLAAWSAGEAAGYLKRTPA